MTTQPRDEKGRFVKTPQRGDIALILIVCIILASFAYFGHRSGYGQGYEDGIVENQPTIYQNGVTAGMEKQKNIDELARNWTRCTNYFYSWERIGYCRNDNPDTIAYTDSDYKIIYIYTVKHWNFLN